MYSLQILQALAILGAAAAGSNENSDVCVTASAYDGTAVSPIPSTDPFCGSDCTSDGYYYCDPVITLAKTDSFASNITACSTAAMGGDDYYMTTEAAAGVRLPVGDACTRARCTRS